VRPEHPHHGTLAHVQIDAVQRLRGAVVLDQPPYGDGAGGATRVVVDSFHAPDAVTRRRQTADRRPTARTATDRTPTGRRQATQGGHPARGRARPDRTSHGKAAARRRGKIGGLPRWCRDGRGPPVPGGPAGRGSEGSVDGVLLLRERSADDVLRER